MGDCVAGDRERSKPMDSLVVSGWGRLGWGRGVEWFVWEDEFAGWFDVWGRFVSVMSPGMGRA